MYLEQKASAYLLSFLNKNTIYMHKREENRPMNNNYNLHAGLLRFGLASGIHGR